MSFTYVKVKGVHLEGGELTRKVGKWGEERKDETRSVYALA